MKGRNKLRQGRPGDAKGDSIVKPKMTNLTLALAHSLHSLIPTYPNLT